MKRILLSIGLMVITIGTVFAAAQRPANEGISAGWGVSLESFKSGGFTEVGFPIFYGYGNKLILRDYFVFSGFGTATGENGILSIDDKVTIGGAWKGGLETYGYLTGGIGAVSGSTKKLLTSPYLWNVGGGGGLQIDLSSKFAFFTELGGGANFTTTDGSLYNSTPLETGYAGITTGFRAFF